MIVSRGTAFLLMFLAAGCGVGDPDSTDEAVLSISAAASLREAVSAVSESFQAAHPQVSLQFNFAGSGSLRQQIEVGAPAEVFLSASPEHIDRLAEAGLVTPENRRIFARNSLVLVSGNESVRSLRDLKSETVTRVAIGDPRSVPAGKYALQWLQAEGVWEDMETKTVLGGDVRQVLSYVDRGEVDAGIVYATDAKLVGLEPVQIASGPTAPEVVYELALIGGSQEPRPVAREFFDYLASEEVVRALEATGFLAP